MKLKTKNHLPVFLASACMLYSGCAYSEDPLPVVCDKTICSNEQEKGFITFTPPQGWRTADQLGLPPSVKIMVVGQGSHTFPPSINLGTEKYKGTLREYLSMIKDINNSQGADWKDLGTIKTQAGNASLSQVDSKTEWGDVRMMHSIIVQDGNAYVLTCAALKEEFPKFYKDFFSSMRSLNFANDPIRSLTNKAQKEEVISLREDLQKSFKTIAEKLKVCLSDKKKALELFESQEFQLSAWVPFKEKLKKDFSEFGESWQCELLDYVKEEMLKKN